MTVRRPTPAEAEAEQRAIDDLYALAGRCAKEFASGLFHGRGRPLPPKPKPLPKRIRRIG
jgi:hypothetical protein